MSFFEKIKVLNKNSNIRKYLDNVIGKLSSSDIIAKDILKSLNNKKTKYVFDEDIKGNYYVYLNDTIYLSSKQSDKNNYERLCVISHECIHSIQPKWLQNINFIFSNLEIICFVIFIILSFLKKSNVYLYSVYLVMVTLSIVSRTILELWAIKKAPQISKAYSDNKKLNKEEVQIVDDYYTFLSKLLTPFAIIQIFFFKLIRLLIISIITFYKF